MKGIVVGIIALVFLVVGLFLMPKSREDKEWDSENKIDTYWEVGDFQLIDQKGQPFSSDELKGKIWLANFVFTSCAAECPLLTQQMSLVRRNLGDRPDIAFVSFSVDPQTDTPKRLDDYAKLYGEDPRWSLLTGEVDTVTELVTKKFLLPLSSDHHAADADDRTISHSDKMLIIDGKGVVRYFCNGLNQRTVESLTEVFQVLLQESGVY